MIEIRKSDLTLCTLRRSFTTMGSGDMEAMLIKKKFVIYISLSMFIIYKNGTSIINTRSDITRHILYTITKPLFFTTIILML